MKRVFLKRIDSYQKTGEINKAAAEVLDNVIKDESITLDNFVPLKVHFGEKGNTTYIEPKNFKGIIDYLRQLNIETAFIETNVLYRGERNTRTKHLKLAEKHGFTTLPVIIADGEYGEEYETVRIDKEHFRECKIAKDIAKLNQFIVISHFKGHIITGFGGALKQLAMGCASRGGKLDQHANAIPKVRYFRCKSCGTCVTQCPANAIVIKKKARIVKDKCVGCASCMAVCPYGAVSGKMTASLSKSFVERMAEYAYAATKGKTVIYITFALNITRGCDCEGRKMKPVVRDIGIFGSTDPVALDQSCLDMMEIITGKKRFKRGQRILEYGESIGLGSREYELVELND